MKIPSANNPLERESFYYDLIQKCLVSREDRRAEYERLRAYYLFGAEPNADPARYNKIFPSLDLLSSFLFASDTTRFAVMLGAGAPSDALPMVPPLIQRLNDKWQDSNADIICGNAVTWGLVYNTMLVKLVVRRNEVHPHLVEPANFGVLQEEIPMLDRQEAFVHTYMASRPAIERELANHPRAADLVSRMSARPRDDSMMPAGLSRIIMSGTYPLSGGTMTGSVEDVLAGTQMYRPRTQEELIEMYELYVWNDDGADGKGDWQMVTMTDPQICIYDREVGSGNVFLPGEHPFIQFCPNSTYDYFWGYSEVQRLTGLQNMREHHLEQLTQLVDRNVDPPKAASGMWQMPDEKNLALSRLNALVSTNDPTAKMQEFKPQIPAELFTVLDKIDAMFDEQIALNHLMRGQGDRGVRSEGQTSNLLRVGSSRPKKRALTIEDSLERMGTLYMKLDQAHDKDELIYEYHGKPEKFLSSQFTKDYMVKVDAHSSSPVFTEDQKDLAFKLFELQVIDGEELLNMIKPQNVQTLVDKWKKMAAMKARENEEMKNIEKADAASKLRAVKG